MSPARSKASASAAFLEAWAYTTRSGLPLLVGPLRSDVVLTGRLQNRTLHRLLGVVEEKCDRDLVRYLVADGRVRQGLHHDAGDEVELPRGAWSVPWPRAPGARTDHRWLGSGRRSLSWMRVLLRSHAPSNRSPMRT